MLAFPLSFLLLPIVVGLGVVYVSAGRLSDRRLRIAVRTGALAATYSAPICTVGPGPAQLILGLVVGYLGLRMVAAARSQRLAEADIKVVALDLITPTGILAPSPRPIRRPSLVILVACAEIGACVVLLVLGNQWRLWQTSRLGHFLDDQLVMLEVATGASGVHGLIVGVAQLLGHPVTGLLDRPFRSTSLTEFWGQRWNRMVQVNLATGFYRPLVRAGFPTLALLAAFAASGAFHVVPLLGAGPAHVIALPCVYVLWCLLGHGVAVLVEQQLGWSRRPVRRSSRAIAWTRTLLLFLALSPGLIEPLAAIANVHGRSLVAPEPPVETPVVPPAATWSEVEPTGGAVGPVWAPQAARSPRPASAGDQRHLPSPRRNTLGPAPRLRVCPRWQFPSRRKCDDRRSAEWIPLPRQLPALHGRPVRSRPSQIPLLFVHGRAAVTGSRTPARCNSGDGAWTAQIASFRRLTGATSMASISMDSQVPETPKKNVSLVLASLPSQTKAGHVLASATALVVAAINATIQPNLFMSTPSNALPFSSKPAAKPGLRFYTGALRRECCNGFMASVLRAIFVSWTSR
jgi:hypothetical protein